MRKKNVIRQDDLALRVGWWAAIACTALSLAYIAAQLLEWTGVLGSAGGPNSASTALGLIWLLTPSLLLGSAFVLLAAALHCLAPPERRVLSLAAFAFAILYAALTGLVYYVQLTFVAPRLAAGDAAEIALLLFRPYQSFLFAIDLLGYSFMSLSTLLGAFALPRGRSATAARRAMIANGLLLPFLAFQMLLPGLIWIAALWAVTFPAMTILIARLMGELAREPSRQG
jgi:hypothetical protein